MRSLSAFALAASVIATVETFTISVSNIDDTIALDLVHDLQGGLEHSVADKPMFDLDYAGNIGVHRNDLSFIDFETFPILWPLHPSPLGNLRSHFCLRLTLSRGSIVLDELFPGPTMPPGVCGNILVADALTRKILAVKFCDFADREPSSVLSPDPFPVFL